MQRKLRSGRFEQGLIRMLWSHTSALGYLSPNNIKLVRFLYS